MDAKNNMIIAKGEPVTSRVAQCSYNAATQKWDVTYINGKTFSYAYNNVIWLKNPVSLDPGSYRVSYKNKLMSNITAIFSFKNGRNEYWHICFETGYENDYDANDLKIDKSCLVQKNTSNVFSYLKQLAKNISVKTEDDTAILQKQYEKIDFLSENNAVAIYLNPEQYRSDTGLKIEPLIFPFGCNKSQYYAVERAVLNRISVIEGPPGTGKTQTILNILANLLIRGQTVQVVSNNNSAIENIIEKLSLPKYNLAFFVALLGRAEKKQQFITSQTGIYPSFDLCAPNKRQTSGYDQMIRTQRENLHRIYAMQNRLAALIEEKKTLEIEQKHFVSVVGNSMSLLPLPAELSAEMILKICQEVEAYLNQEIKMGFLRKIWFKFTYGFSFKVFENAAQDTLLPQLQMMYYHKRLLEVNGAIKSLEKELQTNNADLITRQYVEDSLAYFRLFLAQKYSGRESRKIFDEDDLWKNPDSFLEEYPVVLSTTYTARSSLGRNAQFDYVIMDEASQVDVATGALALSCACNAVIVGDNKQLPNIVTNEQKETLQRIYVAYNVPPAYNFVHFSFLDSLYELLRQRIPKTVLREHYRCDPQIIGYCNQEFYNRELIVMTKDHTNAMQLVLTVAGNHKRGRTNQRQAEVIKQEVLPALSEQPDEIGIITPYRDQVALLQSEIKQPIEISTVHKFQGREKDVIIYCTVDDVITEFSDDPNLLNVAVSRAKKKFILVTSDMEQPVGSHVSDLIGYIRYHNCSETHSSICSVFDYLYAQNEAKRLEFLKNHKRISEYDSENLFYALIEDELQKRSDTIGIVCHQPLYLLIRDYSAMNQEEKRFVKSGLSHLDFLIYSKVTKQPMLAIEVDGYHYHRADSRQGERDRMKDHILSLYHIPLLRFATNGSGERESLQEALKGIC